MSSFNPILLSNPFSLDVPSLNYYVPIEYEDIRKVRDWCYSLENGTIVPCRGREWENDAFTSWEYGFAIKFERSFFLLWDSKVECFQIGTLDFATRFHFGSDPHIQDPVQSSIPFNKYIVLCHGYSPDYGPDYAFVSILRKWFRNVVSPDFRSTYKYGPHRGRSERVRLVLEDLIDVQFQSREHESPPLVVLVGHSQGGACVSQSLQSSKVIRGAGIKGLVLLGSESPIELLPKNPYAHLGLELDDDLEDQQTDETDPNKYGYLLHDSRPSLPRESILLIHSEHDRVISQHQIVHLAQHWELNLAPEHELILEQTSNSSSPSASSSSHLLPPPPSVDHTDDCTPPPSILPPPTPSPPSSQVYLLKTTSNAVNVETQLTDWADDVQHDFIAKELLPKVFFLMEEFLNRLTQEIEK